MGMDGEHPPQSQSHNPKLKVELAGEGQLEPQVLCEPKQTPKPGSESDAR